MSTVLILLLVNGAVVIAVAVVLAIVLVGGALIVAEMLPNGHPYCFHLRNFAITAPKTAWRYALLMNRLFLIGAVLFVTYLTFKYS